MSCAPMGRPRRGERRRAPARAGRPRPFHGPREAGETAHPRGDGLAVAGRHLGESGRGRGRGRHDHEIGLLEDLADELAREPRAQAQGLEVVVRRDAHAHLEARAHRGLELVRPLAENARVDGGALRARNDATHVVDHLGIGQPERAHAGAEPIEDGAACPRRRAPPRAPHRRNSSCPPARREGLGWAARGSRDSRGRRGRSSRVLGVPSRDHLEEQRDIPHGARHGPDMVHGPGQRHRPRPAHPAIGGLEPHDAAAGGGQPDGAAGIGAQRARAPAPPRRPPPSRSRTRPRRVPRATDSARRRGGRCRRRAPAPARPC